MLSPKVLITGGCGFIGTNIIDLLLSYNYNIINLDPIDEEVSNTKYINFENKNYKHIPDYAQMISLHNEIIDKDFDYIIMLASSTHVDKSLLDSYGYFNNNIEATLDVMNYLVQLKVDKRPLPTVIAFSTDEILGGVDKDITSRIELDPIYLPKTHSPYAASKLCAESILWSYMITYDLPIIIVRPCNNFGEYQDKSKFIPKMIDLAKQGKRLEVYGKGEEVREWIYAKDTANIVHHLMLKGEPKNLYHLCSGIRYTNLELAELIAKKYNSSIKFIKNRSGHDFTYNIDSIHKLYNKPYMNIKNWIRNI
jgi:dTDP-glucose 4,6-dehydratase